MLLCLMKCSIVVDFSLLGTPLRRTHPHLMCVVRVTSVDPGLAETEFSEVRFRGDRERAAKVYADTRPLTAEDIADCVTWAASRPAHVNIDQIMVMPTDQAGPRDVHRGGRAAAQ